MQTNLTAGMSDFDTRRFKFRPWYGDQGEYFERVFKPELEGYLHTQGDEVLQLLAHLRNQLQI